MCWTSFIKFSVPVSKTSGWKEEEFSQKARYGSQSISNIWLLGWHFMQMAFSFLEISCLSHSRPLNKEVKNPHNKVQVYSLPLVILGTRWESCSQAFIRAQGDSHNKFFKAAVILFPFMSWEFLLYIYNICDQIISIFKRYSLLICVLNILYSILSFELLAINCNCSVWFYTKMYLGPFKLTFLKM